MMSNKFTNRNHEEVDCTNLQRIKHTNLNSVTSQQNFRRNNQSDNNQTDRPTKILILPTNNFNARDKKIIHQ